MKKSIIVFILSLVLAVSVFAQNRQRDDKDRDQVERDRARIERLEKIKLIEVLNLSEEAVVKFFARRNEYFNNTRYIYEERRRLADNLEADMKSGKKYPKHYYRGLITKMLSLDKDWAEKRAKFYNSLSDILTTEQIAKMLVFAKRFNDELMNEAFKNNKQQK